MSSKSVFILPILTLALVTACSRETNEAPPAATNTTQTAAAPPAADTGQEGSVPLGQRATREEIERQRFNAAWRRLQSFQKSASARRQGTAGAAVNAQFVTAAKFNEKLEGLDFSTVDSLPYTVPVKGDVAGPSVLRAQILLDRAGFSPGVMDGRWGKNSEIAVYWFQRENGITPTGDVDEATFRALLGRAQGQKLVTQYTVTAEDADGPYTKIPEDVYDQAKLDCLCYESIAEKLSERFHASAELLTAMNGGRDLSGLEAGESILVPNVRQPITSDVQSAIAEVNVSVEGNYLHALDASGNILFHAPTTVGSEYDPSPNETLEIKAIAFDPHFHYQPKLFHEVPDDEPEAHLKPGPNSPVGVVWAALTKPHFGIHGTSDPDSIGYATSHGCIRLTNWDARDLTHQLEKGVKVHFTDTRAKG